MRLNDQDLTVLQQAIRSLTPDVQAIRLFGSRLDDDARGGDVDLMLDFDHPIEHPAVLSARLAVRASRAIGGRKVDIVLRAPNLMQSAIHRIAEKQGLLIYP